ncbi:MAG: glycosyltransferase, partial [Bacteroidota bacterium]
PLLTGAALASTYISLSEGFGLPLAEAMACDVPVITSDASCLPEVAGDAALLVNPFETASITESLRNVYENEKLRNSLVARGRVRRGEFSWDKAAEVAWEAVCSVQGSV